MNIDIEFSLKKKDEESEINQDAYELNVKDGIFAIADGVSVSPFSSIWSKKIVTKFVCNPPSISDMNSEYIHEWLEDIQKEWMENIQNEEAHELILELVKEKGSATTFLGGVFDSTSKHKVLNVYAIGDTNIFILRKSKSKISEEDIFPIKSIEQFTDLTQAIFSIKSSNSELVLKKEKFVVEKGDSIILATDAMAKWILKSSNLGQKPWNKILKNKNSIEKFIDELRATNKIDDDDTTCMILQI